MRLCVENPNIKKKVSKVENQTPVSSRSQVIRHTSCLNIDDEQLSRLFSALDCDRSGFEARCVFCLRQVWFQA